MNMFRTVASLMVFFVIFLISLPHVSAQSTTETDSRIAELQKKIAELQNQENNLTNTIKKADSQMTLTLLNIDAKKTSINKLSDEIGSLDGEIVRLEGNIRKYIEVVQKRIPESYKRYVISRYSFVLLGNDFNQLINNYKYTSKIQREQSDVLTQIIKAQQHYSLQKDTRQNKKDKLEQLKKQLEGDLRSLESLKREKKALLEQTKNSETVYQQLLASALAEKKAVDRALVDGVQVGPIKRGDPIALVGNTGYPGCSTAAHLHFEVRSNNTWVDPSGYLSNKSVTDDQGGGSWNVGSGSWNWPISDTVRITQHFGRTPYSWRYAYSGGIHTGFDMISTTSEVIRAPADGTLYSSSQSCGSSIIKIKYIDHGGGIISFYLHVQ